MAYEPKEWVCGETITADDLNHIEQGIANSGGSSDVGYSCEEERQTVFEGSLTTVDMGGVLGTPFVPSEPIEGNTIIVTMDGEEYELPKIEVQQNVIYYGELDNNAAPIFTTYPCCIAVASSQCAFVTSSAETYQVKIENVTKATDTAKCFDDAVHNTLSKKLGIGIKKTEIQVVYPLETTIGGRESSTEVRPSSYMFNVSDDPEDAIETSNPAALDYYFDFVQAHYIRVVPSAVALLGFNTNNGYLYLSADTNTQVERANLTVELYGYNLVATD